MLEALMLAIPSRTSYGTLMQLVGLAMPLSAAVLVTLVVVDWWFPSPEKVSETIFVVILCALVMMGGWFFYPFGFWLVCRWRRAEDRARQVKMQK